jgi:hypothetical protein
MLRSLLDKKDRKCEDVSFTNVFGNTPLLLVLSDEANRKTYIDIQID